MKKFLFLFALTAAALACSLPIQIQLQGQETATPAFLPPTQTPAPTPAPGTEKNPLILALSPAAQPDPFMVSAGERVAAFLASRSGYRVVTIVPSSESALVDALDKGNAHIAVLTPIGYWAARENESIAALFASAQNGEIFYAAQFIANRESEFATFFDEERQENTAEAPTALAQFRDKKPCWSDPASPSGYIVPLGVLLQSNTRPADGAFLEGQASVARAVYAGDICNFGATYVDVRALPALEANYPNISERVKVIWRTEKIIPYENISAANTLPFEMRRTLQRAFIDLLLTEEGRADFQEVYGLDELQVVEDSDYDPFIQYVRASGLGRNALLAP